MSRSQGLPLILPAPKQPSQEVLELPTQTPRLTDLVDLELQTVEVGVPWQREREALLKLCWKIKSRETQAGRGRLERHGHRLIALVMNNERVGYFEMWSAIGFRAGFLLGARHGDVNAW